MGRQKTKQNKLRKKKKQRQEKMKKRRAATLEESKVQKQLDRIQWETRQRIKPYRMPKEDG